MMYMIGVGPFITLPLIVAAMGGSQALLGWMLGALIAVCDGLVWAELGAAMPEAGGSYAFLREIYGPRGRGALRLLPLHLSAGIQRAALDCLRAASDSRSSRRSFFPGWRPDLRCLADGPHWTSFLAAGACAVILVVLL